MAKDYMTLQEVCEALGKSAEEVESLVASGMLSEVRDAEKIFYKRTEIEQIAAKEGSSIVDLAAPDEELGEAAQTTEAESFASALSSLADSSSGLDLLDDMSPEPQPAESGAAEAAPVELPVDAIDVGGASPAELVLEDIPEDLPAAPKEPDAADALAAEIDLLPAEAPEVPDLGLSGSSILSLGVGPEETAAEAPPAEAAPAGKKVGISVFDDDELEIESDPMGETQITSSVEDFDAVGSGSGLLDLTRESDDTSLGAELLDVISPSEAAETVSETDSAEVAVVDDSAEVAETMVEQTAEPMAVAGPAPRVKAAAAATGTVPLNVCALTGVLGLALLGLATASQIQGVWPAFLSKIAGGQQDPLIHGGVFGGVALVAIVTGVIGILAGRGK